MLLAQPGVTTSWCIYQSSAELPLCKGPNRMAWNAIVDAPKPERCHHSLSEPVW